MLLLYLYSVVIFIMKSINLWLIFILNYPHLEEDGFLAYSVKSNKLYDFDRKIKIIK